MNGARRVSNLVGGDGAVRTALLLLALSLPATAQGQGILENPAPASVNSGVGVLSGWKCSAASASSITLAIDDLPPIQAAYGTGRADTSGVCGDANNGFGVLFNYGLLPDGEHEVVVADAGVEFARATFSTAKFGVDFLSGAHGATFARDFPEQGRGAFLIWQQSSQSFTVGGTCGGDGKVICPPTSSLTAWTYADQETVPGPYTSDANSSSTSGLPSQITRSSTGVYAVTMGGLAFGTDTESGVVHVTARQGNANFCVVAGWNAGESFSRVVDVRCFDASGAPADTRFDVVFSRPAPGNEVRGFLWANASSADIYVPDLQYQYNAAGPLAEVERFGPGSYRAYLPGLSPDGLVGFMVSAYGVDPRRCRVLAAGVFDDARFGVGVACEDATGAPSDSRFTLSVIRDTPLVTMSYNVLGAYLRTYGAETPQVGVGGDDYNEVGGTNSVQRTATGRYVARLGNFALYDAVGNVQVTAVGEGASHCTIESSSGVGSNVEVVVLCFDGATPANSEFALTYTR
jgi:hypothetical protein